MRAFYCLTSDVHHTLEHFVPLVKVESASELIMSRTPNTRLTKMSSRSSNSTAGV